MLMYYQRLLRQKTRLLNQMTITLKEYYPRALEVFDDLETQIALDFLHAHPPPQGLSKMTRLQWKRFAKGEHHLSEACWQELWEKINKPQITIPDHVVRAKAKLLLALVAQLEVSATAIHD